MPGFVNPGFFDGRTARNRMMEQSRREGLYDPANEHDACGVGFVAHIKGAKTHAIVSQALKILENLDHRGAVGADALMGDGAGILIQLPDALYREDMAKLGVTLPPQGEYGVGMIFLPKEHASRLACEQELERAIRAEGQVLLGWRDVPVNRDMPMSPTVREKEPVMRQIFIGRGADVIVQDALERKLYVIRKTASAAIQALGPRSSNEVRRQHVTQRCARVRRQHRCRRRCEGDDRDDGRGREQAVPPAGRDQTAVHPQQDGQ
jgi:glutamate synthase (NADPH/NADH) large chain/glutamate synthase (ferredoxin)